MLYYEVLIKTVPRFLTYRSELPIPIGSLVKASLNKKNAHGIVMKEAGKPGFMCENIEEVLIPAALSELQMRLCVWMAQYYFAPLSKCVALFVPPVIWNAKKKPKRDENGELLNPDKDHPSKPYHGKPLTRQQKKVLRELCHSDRPADRRGAEESLNFIKKGIPRLEDSLGMTTCFLLHGVTGSGKTEIYLQLIKKMIQKDRQTVLLVPEIALTSELIRHFAGHFPDQISIIHSRISEGARLQSWHRILEGKTKIILGSRSALFTPWRNLGAIIIDEEHEWTYKSEQTPRYHTRTVAEKIVEFGISNLEFEIKPLLLLGSASPSIETYSRTSHFKIQNSKFKTPSALQLLTIKKRATAYSLPHITVVDLRQEFQKKNLSMISDTLASAITERLLKKEQVILFLNKRGAASCVICRDCGFTPRCKRCDLGMTYHLKMNWQQKPHEANAANEAKTSPPDGLLCHSCSSYEPTPLACPLCKSLAIRYVGSGTQKLQVQLQSMFPQARILRADKDTVSARHAFEHIYQKMWNQEADILLGTQMITKGLDLPNVTLVGIVIADIGLHIPDFRASERVFQLLTQVSGRSGRHKPGEVVIQTYQPKHPAVVAASNHDYQGFYEQEIHNREQFFYPPFSNLIRLSFAHKDPKRAEEEARKLFQQLNNRAIELPRSLKAESYKLKARIDLSPHYIPKLHNKFIWNILIRAENPRQVIESVERRPGWTINVDLL